VNVLFVSQCSKNALKETRRILDQFAERRGERTWQTSITQEGLDTVRRLLKKTARKNTAVACHWIRGRDHSEVLWIVGDARQFNPDGAVPTNTTLRNVLRSRDENDWRSAADIQLLAVMAALFHDIGKASRAFQRKLRDPNAQDGYRHEWISLRIFEAFVGDDDDATWLERLARISKASDKTWLDRIVRDGTAANPKSPFSRLGPLAQMIGWLILTHHRLPCPPGKFNSGTLRNLPLPIVADWATPRLRNKSPQEKSDCWEFDQGLPFDSASWCERVSRCATQMLARTDLLTKASSFRSDPHIMHLARLVVMLADHHYSSLPSSPRYGDPRFPLFANTDRKTKALKQRLDEHLIGVGSHAGRLMRVLPRLHDLLPRIARHKGFKRRTAESAFRWQDRAFDLAAGLHRRAEEHGFFGVNMASTGCGKTLANGRIMYGLSDPSRGARFTIALGLRTLTLQTGRAYRERLGLGEDDLAILVGGGAVRELFEARQRESELQFAGSESAESLLPANSYVHFEAALGEGPLTRWLDHTPGANKLVSAPIVVCTIDHLMPATESTRGGSQIAPMLRLLTSDVVLDEVDDFDVSDLPALTRLVHWIGMLGGKVLLSSATLPPALVLGLFESYREGRRIFQRHRGVNRALSVSCAWFDEFGCVWNSIEASEAFASTHAEFVHKRLRDLDKAETRRIAKIVSFETPPARESGPICRSMGEQLPGWMLRLHADNHCDDPRTGKRASFGLVRLANIDPLVQVAQALCSIGAPDGFRVHLCVYHSRFPLIVRSGIERVLDRVLQRGRAALQVDQALTHPMIRSALDHFPENDHVFVVIASPVAEVGRDHDYDWAIVEPSSVRSIIQLAGRIRRHRAGPRQRPNIFLLNKNIRSAQGESVAYCRPGFENEVYRLATHNLPELLLNTQLNPLTSAPRILERAELQPDRNLGDLEHRRLRALMLAEGEPHPVSHWWTTPAHLFGGLQREQKFRKGPVEKTFALLPDEDDDTAVHLHRNDEGRWVGPLDHLLDAPELTFGPRVSTWATPVYSEALGELADEKQMALRDCAERFGVVELEVSESTQGWHYHPWLGFWRRR
jgi:CRISPR-associated endonuclease/helicase Cas3